MTSPVLLDTHACVWSLGQSIRLSGSARETILEAEARYVSPVSVFEVANKVRLGKWPEMTVALPQLIETARKVGMIWIDVTPEIAHLAGTLDWPHRDPFDRLIAATALVNGWALISADTAFDTLIGLRRIW